MVGATGPNTCTSLFGSISQFFSAYTGKATSHKDLPGSNVFFPFMLQRCRPHEREAEDSWG